MNKKNIFPIFILVALIGGYFIYQYWYWFVPKYDKVKVEEQLLLKRDSVKKNDLYIISKALQIYRQKNGSYPISNETEKINKSSAPTSQLYNTLVGEYLYAFPFDQEESKFYEYTSNGSYYEISAVLKNVTDPECVLEKDICVYRIRDGEIVSNK